MLKALDDREGKIRNSLDNADKARKELIEATKNRKALELLRDRQRQDWELEQRRMEAKRLDEQTTQQYAAKILAEPDPCEPSSPRSSSSSWSTP